MTKHPDLFSALDARDAALDQVARASGSFMEDAMRAIEDMPRGRVTGEDVRLWLEGLGISPHHHNAWGAVVMAATRRGLLLPTSEFTHMRGSKSHGRMTRVYMTAVKE